MNAAQHYTLAPDVEIVPVEMLPEQTRKKFHHSGTDFVITHRNTRKESKIIAPDAADLLRRFHLPSTWAEAIFEHALANQRDPQQVAEEAFALLAEMHEAGFLVTGEETIGQEQLRFIVGNPFLQYTIKEPLRVLDDSAVYRVEDSLEQPFALKVFKADKEDLPPLAFQNEKTVLQTLDGRVNPKLIEEGRGDGMYYLVLEWCKGESCNKAAAPYRNFNLRGNVLAVTDLCLFILEAYSRLHQQGFLHGDVHPANILVDKNKITIIDYGYSAPAQNSFRTVRGGLHLYYEPELAKALLDGEPPPPATTKSEQYAVAVLLYSLLAGEHYLPLAYEPATAYRQILTEAPRTFNALDLNLPASFDDVFRVALAKNPADRFASISEFRMALENCRAAVLTSPAFFIGDKQASSEQFLRFLTSKYGWESPLLQNGLAVPPTASVNDGAAGIAYLFYRMACVQQDSSLLALADVWANRAADFSANYETAFLYANPQLPDEGVERSALYHSPTGVHLVQALISSCAGDRYSFRKAVDDYLLAADVSCDELDLTTGKAGLLIGGAVLLRELKTAASQEVTRLTPFTNKLMQDLWRGIDSFPAMSEPNPVGYFGIAHGWAGLLYATALWCMASGAALPQGFRNRTEELLAQGIKENGTLRWPLSITDNASWPGWCHGNAGYVFLWTLLYELLHDERMLVVAEQCANSLKPDSRHTAHLCCGLAGQAYALLKLYRVSGKKEYWKRVEQMKQAILGQLFSAGLRNNSLYKGEVGIGVLLTELQRPELARMPLFE